MNINNITSRLSLFAFFLILGLLIFVSLIPYQYIQLKSIDLSGFHLNLLRVLPVLIIMTITLFSVLDVVTRKMWVKLKDLNVYLFLLALTGLMCCFSSFNFQLSISRWIYYILTGIVLFYLVVGTIQNKERTDTILISIVILGVVVALYGIIEFLGKNNFLFGSALSNNNFLYFKLMQGSLPLTSENRIVATIGHPVTLGFFFLPSLIFSFALIDDYEKPLFKTFFVISAIIIAAGILLTFSRGSWVALVIALGIYLSRKSKTAIIYIAVAITMIISIMLYLPEIRRTIINRNPSSYWNDPVSQNRIMSYLTVSKIFQDYPLMGVGIANFRILRKQYDEFYTTIEGPDNLFLMTLAETGLIGLILLCIVLWQLSKRVFNAYKKTINIRSQNMIWSCYSLYIGLITNMLTFDVFNQPVPRILFWIVAGILVGVCEVFRNEGIWSTKIPVTSEIINEYYSDKM